MHPFGWAQESTVQKLASSQVFVTPTQTSKAQVSLTVQGSPSSHGKLAETCWQMPPVQPSTVQTSPSSQFFCTPTHAPPPQLSPTVHAFPSSQSSPSLTEICTQVPLAESHPPLTLHSFTVLQTLGEPLTHSPAMHASPKVHKSPSSQAPLRIVLLQPFKGSHASFVHDLPSSQFSFCPAHFPALHASPVVHALPSSQAAVLAVVTQPVEAQVLIVQGLESVQETSLASAMQPPL